MTLGAKYEALGKHLKAQTADEVHLAFLEIESILGFSLPASARQHTPWWGNHASHSQAAAWLAAGWVVARVSLHSERVTFQRGVAKRRRPQARKATANSAGFTLVPAEVPEKMWRRPPA
jgi:hypothetical protein